MNKVRALLAGFAACASAQHALAAEIQSVDLGSDTFAIAIEGDISNGDAEKFRREAAKYKSAIVMLESDGGSTLEAIEIGEAIRLRGFSTLVINGSRCVSACGLIWLAGTPRALSQSARVGFHATYSDETGKRLESGVGNALVGRYFALLNLPEKAIIFATEASPSQLNWLDRSNYLNAGIEVRLIDDWDDNKSTAPETTPVAPPPIQTRSPKPDTQTVTWKKIGAWTVMMDASLANSCFLVTSFTDGSWLRLGFDRSDRGRTYAILANPAWASLSAGQKRPMSLKFDTETPWEGNSNVVDMNGVNALMMTFTDNKFWGEFAQAHSLEIASGSRHVANLSLSSAPQAFDSLIECQKHYNAQSTIRDPFAP